MSGHGEGGTAARPSAAESVLSDRANIAGWPGLSGADPEMFFPVGPVTGSEARHADAAKADCGRCVVRANCLSYALAAMPEGIWGGPPKRSAAQHGDLPSAGPGWRQVSISRSRRAGGARLSRPAPVTGLAGRERTSLAWQASRWAPQGRPAPVGPASVTARPRHVPDLRRASAMPATTAAAMTTREIKTMMRSPETELRTSVTRFPERPAHQPWRWPTSAPEREKPRSCY